MARLLVLDSLSAGVPVSPPQEASAVGPGKNTKAPGYSVQPNPLDSTNVLRSFLARGIIRDVPEGGATLVVRHEAIPGFMPKMTMEFNVRNTNELRGLRAGDAIAFRVKASQEESWIEGLRKIGTNELADALPADPPSTALLRVGQLHPGELLQDAELLGEDGRSVKFSDFKGRALAFTFIFTRCPLPDFCPRMNLNFSRARELLQADQSGPTNWQFLSISFDPGFDKPGVLSRYAYSYRGSQSDRWLFASAPSEVLASLGPQLDFRFASSGGGFMHNLRTVVLDPQGRIYRHFDGNKWTAKQLALAIAEAARIGP